MKSFSACLFLVAWVGCSSNEAPIDDDTAVLPDACTSMECAVANCQLKGMPRTSVSGRVMAPNGTLPLSGAIVYVPLASPGPLPDGPRCDRCDAEPLGGALTQTSTDAFGRFSLQDVPADMEFPIVIQIGSWRREIMSAPVAACQDTPLPEDETRLPRDRSEGDLPRIAVTTGSADALECLVRKLGIADDEITTDAGDGRVNLFAGNGANKFATTFPAQGSFPDAQTLWNDPAKLAAYDIVILSCEGAQRPQTKPLGAMEALRDYADHGGRVFMSHWHNIWLGGEKGNPAHGLAEWRSLIQFDFNAAQNEATQTAIIDRGSSRGETFATWLKNVGATTGDTLIIHEPRYTAKRLASPELVQTWLHVDPTRSTPLGKESVQDVVFTTPVGADADARCGKVVFSDMHVSSGSSSKPSVPYPSSCATGDLTPQEKALAFILFDMAACVSPIL
ncbi:MAG: carboxypeptidase regulatory-like domain-containing protein [Kofleriaceae bacterium]